MAKSSETYKFLEIRINMDLEIAYWDHEFVADVTARLSDEQVVGFKHSSESFNMINDREESLEDAAARELKHMLVGLGHRLAMRLGDLPSLPLYGKQ